MIQIMIINFVDAAYMDFRKAFDTVPHQRLITKLKSYNIKGPILNWIVSFLSDRSQFVKINNSTSNNLKVTRKYITDKCDATRLVCLEQVSETQSETGRGKSETNIEK